MSVLLKTGAGQALVGAVAPAAAKSPPLAVPTLDGKTIEIHKQPGKVVLADFMTTTCPSCRQASVGIQAVYRELGAKGFLPVAIALGPRAEGTLPFYRNLHGLTFPLGAVALEEAIRYLDHPGNRPIMVPTLVLLDKRGNIAMKETGWIGEQKLREAVSRLLSRNR